MHSFKLFILITSIIVLFGCQQAAPRQGLAPRASVQETSPETQNPDATNTVETTKTTETAETLEAVEVEAAETVQPTQTAVESNLWQRLINGFAIPVQDHPRIQRELEWYKKHPRHMERVCQHAVPFLYDIVEVLEQNSMPTELALLPVIESAYRPDSYSSGRAAGLWQFIPSTGTMMGLQQNWWYDGRRDIHASTRAAINYLKSLYKMLGNDWLHALAGYNAGPGHVIKAVKHNRKYNRPADYWDLRLPKETMSYVPKLLAVKEVISNPSVYGTQLCDIPNSPQLELVEFDKQLDLSIAAKMAQLSVDDLYKYNPGFSQWATPPQGPHHLLLPRDNVALFKLAESGLPEEQRVRWKKHTIKSGDTLSAIAAKYHTTIKEIKASNQLSSNFLRAGKYLLIPTSSQSDHTYGQAQREQHPPLKSRKKHKAIYTVRPGDSWWKIAQAHNTNHHKLAHWNNKSSLDLLQPGQNLVIYVDERRQRSGT